MTNLISRIVVSALVLQAGAFAESPQEQDQEYTWDCPGSGYLPYRRNLLVSTGELAQGMENSEVTLIHVGFETSGPGTLRRATYSDGHLPGARHWMWSDFKEAADSLPPAENRWPVLAALGISRERPVVLYDTGLGFEAAAAFVVLDSLGLADRAALLDGQWVKWVSEGRPLRRWGEEGAPSDLEPSPSSVALSQAEVAALALEAGRLRPAVSLLDARMPPGEGRPHASPLPFMRMSWSGNLASLRLPVFKSEAELRRLWASVPARPGHRVVVAARHWREAAPVYFVARLLGYSVQILDGSLEDLETSRSTLERGS